MKKILIMGVACVALLVGAIAPAIAQDQSFDAHGIKSGSANPSVKISNSGSYVNLCTPIQQVANTGNVINQQGVNQGGSQYDSSTGDEGDSSIDMEGSSINIDPTLDASCDQTITVTK